jgi:hypothetical protein
MFGYLPNKLSLLQNSLFQCLSYCVVGKIHLIQLTGLLWKQRSSSEHQSKTVPTATVISWLPAPLRNPSLPPTLSASYMFSHGCMTNGMLSPLLHWILNSLGAVTLSSYSWGPHTWLLAWHSVGSMCVCQYILLCTRLQRQPFDEKLQHHDKLKFILWCGYGGTRCNASDIMPDWWHQHH